MTRDRPDDGTPVRRGVRRGLRDTVGSRSDREAARRGRGQAGAGSSTAGDRPLAEGLPAEAWEAMRRGRKIQAIKIVREATGLGLAQAKALVEQEVERVDAASGSERFRGSGAVRAAGREDSGILRLIVILGALAAMAALWLAL